jgi:hypothetical protein
MLNRSIPIREALVHSIPISEVKDMKSDVLWALMASLSEKKIEPYLQPLSNSIFPFITYPFLLIDFLKYKNQVFLIF